MKGLIDVHVKSVEVELVTSKKTRYSGYRSDITVSHVF